MTYARNKALGRFGEQVAAVHLADQGMTILARNWRCPHGEIDIVARDGATLVVCEVKTRTTRKHGGPFEAITAHKATRLRRLLQAWLAAHDVHPLAVRIDVVSVLVPARGAPVVDRIAGVA